MLVQYMEQGHYLCMCITYQAEKIYDENSIKKATHIRNTFMKIGYPEQFVSQILSTTPRRQSPMTETEDTTTSKPLPTLHIHCLSEKIQTTCRKISIRTIFKSQGQWWMKLQTCRKKRGSVQDPMPDCDPAYIG